jgi:hypothetical protein
LVASTIAKIIMTARKPSGIQPVFESQVIGPVGFHSLAKFTLRHRLLIVIIGDYARACRHGRRYAASLSYSNTGSLREGGEFPAQCLLSKLTISCQDIFPSLGPFTSFFATKTHLVKVSNAVELEIGIPWWNATRYHSPKNLSTIAFSISPTKAELISKFVALAFDYGQDSISISFRFNSKVDRSSL